MILQLDDYEYITISCDDVKYIIHKKNLGITIHKEENDYQKKVYEDD
jgi:hypothetical protein